jgi:DNA-binding NtrC family response regulator
MLHEMHFEDSRGAVTWQVSARDYGRAANDESASQPRILVLQRELVPNLSLISSIASAGFDPVGPFNKVSRAISWLERERPDAAILDTELRDGVCLDLANELLRRQIPFLFYTSQGDRDRIPTKLGNLPFLEKPTHFVLVTRLLSKLHRDGQVLEAESEDDLERLED